MAVENQYSLCVDDQRCVGAALFCNQDKHVFVFLHQEVVDQLGEEWRMIAFLDPHHVHHQMVVVMLQLKK